MPVSPFSDVPLAPPDPILGLTEAYNADLNPNKVNLGVGVYQDENAKVPLLEVVRIAEERWQAKEDTKNYLTQVGAPAYTAPVQALLLGDDSPLAAAGRVITLQAPGGTGALRVGAEFLKRFHPHAGVYISQPSWENHRAIFEAAGFEVGTYPYYDPATHSLDFDAMLNGLKALPEGSVVVLHACCHNPTGVDPTPAQWDQIADFFADSSLIAFIDFAYQGFAESLDADAYAIRAFAARDIPCLIASSFSKSFSLYRERVGALTFLTRDKDEAARVLSQVKRVVRSNYSNPPSHGAQVAALVLTDPALRARWIEELAEMRERIKRMRTLFVERLKAEGVTRDFSFIERQNGMFSFTGLPVEVVRRLRSENGLYIVDSSRVCIAAMNERNVGYICKAIAAALA